MDNFAKTDPDQLRTMAAILTALSGTAQCLALWLLPTTPMLLLTALTGAVYLLLALGLFGASTFTLLLTILLLPLRSWFGLFPLDIPAWELIRIAIDLAIGTLCIPVLWAALDSGHKAGPSQTLKTSEDSSAREHKAPVVVAAAVAKALAAEENDHLA